MTNTELTKIREERNLSKSDFAKLLGVTPMLLGRYEKGSCAIPEDIAKKLQDTAVASEIEVKKTARKSGRKTKEEAAGEMIDPAQYAEGLTALREAVSAFDFDTADELIGMLKEYVLPEGERERFLRICDLVTRVDRDALLQELE